MTRPSPASRIFLQPDDGEKARILWSQIRDVTDVSGWVKIFHFCLRQFQFVQPEEAFDLCFLSEASLEDIGQRGKAANNLLTVREPKHYRLDAREMDRWNHVGRDRDSPDGPMRSNGPSPESG